MLMGTIIWIGIVGSFVLVGLAGYDEFWDKFWRHDEEEA